MTQEKNALYPFGANIPDGGYTGDDATELLGGKGANLARMSAQGINVPPGFTITTEWANKERTALFWDVVHQAYETLMGVSKVPLVSIRSGARVSMPGMMDTILNVGINDDTYPELAEMLGHDTASDCYCRMVEMLSDVVFNVPMELYARIRKELIGVPRREDMTPTERLQTVDRYKEAFKILTGHAFPDTPKEQLTAGIDAVFGSWHNERAKLYRKEHGIPEEWGTACTVQTMVFGNLNDYSGTGVVFSRNPQTGVPQPFGEFLPKAQGEDVVAGTHTPKPLTELPKHLYDQLLAVLGIVENMNKDMQDVEFTIQDDELFILQTRNGKRSAKAAVRIALDLMDEKVISKAQVVGRVDPKQMLKLTDWTLALPEGEDPYVLAKGLSACAGFVPGRICIDMSDIKAANAEGVRAIYAAVMTTPEDLDKMLKADAILTLKGGATSHAAVVARGLDKPCVVGCGLSEDVLEGWKGMSATMDGAGGMVYSGEYEVIKASPGIYEERFFKLLGYDPKIVELKDFVDMEDLTALDEALAEATGVVYEQTGFYAGANGALFYAVLGVNEAELKGMLASEDILEAANNILDAMGKTLPAAGLTPEQEKKYTAFETVSEAESVADVLKGKPMTPSTIKKVFGTKTAYNKVIKACKVTPVAIPVTLGQIVAEVANGAKE